MTLPCFPRSPPFFWLRPEMTWTRSPFLMRMEWVPMSSEHLRCERDDLHEPLLAQLATHRAEDAGSTGVAVGLEDDGGVLVELDVGPVGPAALLDGAHDDGLDDVALLDVAPGDRVLDGRDDGVADPGVAAPGPAEHPDAE